MQDDLGPVDREGRDDDGAVPREGEGDDGGELRPGGLMVVVPVAVGGLHEEHVGTRERLRRQQQRVPRAAQVTGGGQGGAVLQRQVGPCRAEDVSAVVECEPGAGHDLHVLADGHGVEERQGLLDVRVVVERFGRAVLGPAVCVGVPGGLHLEPRAVAQHDPGEPGGVGAGQDRSPESLPHQAGQIAAVVQVGMGDDHGVHVRGVAGEPLPVAVPQLRETLEETAVEEDPRMVALDQEPAAGDRPHATRETRQGRPRGRGSGIRGCLGHGRPSFGTCTGLHPRILTRHAPRVRTGTSGGRPAHASPGYRTQPGGRGPQRRATGSGWAP